MDIGRVKQAIARCRSRVELQEVIKAAQARAGELVKREQERRERAAEEAWLAAKKAAAGHLAIVVAGGKAAPIVVPPGSRSGHNKG